MSYDIQNTFSAVTSEPAYGLFPGADLGQDLSGSLQGAGGVGGLLIVSLNGTNCFPAFDGNGNVMSLVTASDGTIVAEYEYGPFGETLKANGTLADANTFRFSTKAEDESGLLYYGYRYYDPETGRWLSFDPIGEGDSSHGFGACANNVVNDIDVLGMFRYSFIGLPWPSDKKRDVENLLNSMPLVVQAYVDKLDKAHAALVAAEKRRDSACPDGFVRQWKNDIEVLQKTAKEVLKQLGGKKTLRLKLVSISKIQDPNAGMLQYHELPVPGRKLPVIDFNLDPQWGFWGIYGKDNPYGIIYHELIHLVNDDWRGRLDIDKRPAYNTAVEHLLGPGEFNRKLRDFVLRPSVSLSSQPPETQCACYAWLDAVLPVGLSVSEDAK